MVKFLNERVQINYDTTFSNNKDNFIMKFFSYNLHGIYENLRKDWIGKFANLLKDDILFYCGLKKLAYFFYKNGGVSGLSYVIKNMYISDDGLDYYPIKLNSFKSTYSKLKSDPLLNNIVEDPNDRFKI